MENLQASPSTAAIGAALKAARAEIPVIVKNAVNPHFQSKYADLSSILKVVVPILDKHGIIAVFAPYSTEEQVGVELCLLHVASGEFMSCSLALKPQRMDPQGAGSAVTYARRYALSAMLNLDTDDDDDGNAATPPPTTARRSRTKVEDSSAKKMDRPAQIRRLMAALRDYAKYEPEDAAKLQVDSNRHATLRAMFQKDSLNDLTDNEMESLITTVINRYKRAAEQAGQ